MRTSRPAAAAALTCTAALVLGGCSLLGQDEPERDAAGQVTEATDAGAFTLRVGDCLEPVSWDGGATSSFPVIPCAEEHESEIYASMLLDDGEYPGPEAVNAAASEYCASAFAEFVGTPWEQSDLQFAFLVPTAETWEQQGDREVLCLVMDPEALTTGTLEGAAR